MFLNYCQLIEPRHNREESLVRFPPSSCA